MEQHLSIISSSNKGPNHLLHWRQISFMTFCIYQVRTFPWRKCSFKALENLTQKRSILYLLLFLSWVNIAIPSRICSDLYWRQSALNSAGALQGRYREFRGIFTPFYTINFGEGLKVVVHVLQWHHLVWRHCRSWEGTVIKEVNDWALPLSLWKNII